MNVSTVKGDADGAVGPQPHFAMYYDCGPLNQSPIDENNLGCFHSFID